jgi:hypothetical protein
LDYWTCVRIVGPTGGKKGGDEVVRRINRKSHEENFEGASERPKRASLFIFGMAPSLPHTRIIEYKRVVDNI